MVKADYTLNEIASFHENETYKGKTFAKCYEVIVDGEVVGRVDRRLACRERKAEGRRYVSSRWYSPGWFAETIPVSGRSVEYSSRKAAAESLAHMVK